MISIIPRVVQEGSGKFFTPADSDNFGGPSEKLIEKDGRQDENSEMDSEGLFRCGNRQQQHSPIHRASAGPEGRTWLGDGMHIEIVSPAARST